MQKALLMASVIIGAFLFQPNANSQVLTEDGKLGIQGSDMCPLGGNYAPALGFCFVAATSSFTYRFDYGDFSSSPDLACQSASNGYRAHIYNSQAKNDPNIVTGSNGYTLTSSGQNSFNCKMTVTGTYIPNGQSINWSYSDNTVDIGPEVYQCPPESSNPNFQVFNLGPYETEEGYKICFYLSNDPDNDDGNECPDGTIGGCDIPDPDECFEAGNGMEVCRKDPNDICDSYEHDGKIFYDCPAGCGFINDQLYCTTDPDIPDIPDLSKCFKVGNSWACPPDSPTPDDDIDNPEKPLSEMTKGDFKQVQRGVETRLDGTNKLLGDIAGIGKATGEGIEDLNAKALAANKKLDDIIKNTGKTAENLEGDGLELDTNYIDTFKGAFGITGDESIDDLTKTEITLDQFRSEFQWTGGNSSCPPPRSIQIIGQTFSMNWEPFCTAFNVIGYLILAAAYFLSIRIAFGGRY